MFFRAQAPVRNQCFSISLHPGGIPDHELMNTQILVCQEVVIHGRVQGYGGTTAAAACCPGPLRLPFVRIRRIILLITRALIVDDANLHRRRIILLKMQLQPYRQARTFRLYVIPRNALFRNLFAEDLSGLALFQRQPENKLPTVGLADGHEPRHPAVRFLSWPGKKQKQVLLNPEDYVFFI